MKARFLALAALVLGLASCQQEFNGAAQLGGEVDFQLKVDAAELATRAGENGVNDTNNAYDSAFGAIDYLQAGGVDDYRVNWAEVDLRYSLEVYDWNEEGDYAGAVPVKDRMVKIVDAYESVVFDLRLVPGRIYHFVVFADFVPNGASNEPNVTYQSTLGKRHFIGDNLGDIRIKENEDAINDEIGDAYFATKKVEVKHQALNVDGIVLQRPYGKLRVIATDLAELNLNVEPKSVFVKYTADRPVHFNAVTGAVETDATVKEYTSVYNEGVCKLIANNTNGLANHFYNAGYDSGSEAYSTVNADGVKRHTHMTLFTDYILAIDEQTTVQFEMTVSDANKEIKKTIFNTEIPVQRNHLTTIVGNVLTSATEISVTIDDNFANANDELTNNDYYQVVATDGYEVVKAAMEQYKVILDGGVDENGNKLPITVTIKDFEKYFAQLNTRAAQTTYTFPNGTEIDLNGYTLIIVNDSDQPLIVVEDNKTLNIVDNSDNDKGEVILRGEGDGAAIENNGTLNIEGVELKSETDGSVIDNNGEANIVDSTLNNGALTNDGEANIAGGTLNAGSVENNGMTNVNGGTVNGGAIENGDNATVGSYIKDATGLQKAIDAAGKNGANNVLTLDADIVGNVTILQKKDVNLVIDGKGNKKFDGVITVNGDGRANGTETLKIMGINFETTKSDITFISAPSKIDGKYNYSHNVTIEGCTFKGNHTVGCASFTGTYNFVMQSCVADNVHSIAQIQSVDNTATIDDVTVRNSKNGLSFGNTANATLKNSTIIADNYGVRGDGNASRGNLVIENTTIVAATPVVIRKVTTDGYKVELKNPEKLSKNGFYHVVFTTGNDDEAYAAPATNYSIEGADNLVVFPYTWEVKSKAEFDKALASPATSKITFGSDITGNLTIEQKPDVKLTIDGANKNLNGYITVDGKSATITSAGLTIKNLNFNADTIGADACVRLGDGTNATRYTCNVTVDNCTFDVNGAVGVKSYTGGDKNLTIKGCTATSKAHSLVQAAGIDTINVEGCNVSSKNGMNFNQSDNVAIDGCTVDVQGYAVRYGVSSGTFNTAETYTISDSTLKSACEDGDAVIVLRATADNATLTIENTTIEGTPEIINNASNAIITYKGYNYCADGLYKKGVEYYVTNANGLATLNAKMADKSAGKNVKVVLGNDIDFTGKTWTPVDSHADSSFYFNEFDGQGHTISNLTINGQAMFTRFAGFGDVTIKDVTFDKANVNSNGTINTSILTVQSYQNVLLDNVDVKNSTITGGYKVAPLIATVYNESPSTITATLKNCDVEDVTVTATSYDFCTTGMVAFVNAGNNDTITFENCSVKNVELYAPNVYTAHAAIYTTGSETLFNEAEGVTVTNVTFENI